VRACVTPSEELKAIIGKTSRIRKSEYGSSTADVEQAAHCAKCQRQPNRERNETARAASADAGRPSVMLRTYESTTGRYRAARVAVRTRRIHPLAAANDRAHPPNE